MMPVIVQPASAPDQDSPMPSVPVADLIVEWQPVTASQDGRPIVITGYEVTVEKQITMILAACRALTSPCMSDQA